MTDDAPDEHEPENHDDEPALGTMLGIEDGDVVHKNKGVGVGFVFAGFVVASLLGGFIGIVGPKVFQHPNQAQQLRDEMRAELDALTQSTDEQSKTIETLMARLQKQQTLIAKLETSDGEILTSLGKQQESIAAYAKQVSSLDKPNNERANNKPNPNSLQDNVIEPATKATPDILETIVTKPGNTYNNVETPQTPLSILIETFPREKLLVAVQAQGVLSQKKPGWLRRALRKHVKVRDEVTLDPYATIDAAEAALKQGRIQDALDNIAKLNPTVRTAAAEWVRAAKKTL